MNRLLEKGDVFRLMPNHPLVVGQYIHPDKNTEPTVDFTTLKTDCSDAIHINWTEKRMIGGTEWERPRETLLNLRAPDAVVDDRWRVTHTESTGGGTGMGPNDVYPDGHRVSAKRVGGKETLTFYQTGAFIGMIPPDGIELVKR
jgi:hypothetical protein